MSGLPEAVVLFGASGFIGRNILAALSEKIPQIIGVTGGTAEVPGCTRVVPIARFAEVPPLPVETILINAAARRYDAGRFAAEQGEILDINSRIAAASYQLCIDRNIREVRLASSVAVYPADWALLDDERTPDFDSPPHAGEADYAWSKRFAEIDADAQHRAFGIHTLTFRLTNPYGPFDATDINAAHVAPAFVMRALAPGDAFEIRGNPDAERDFVFAGDVANVFLGSLVRRGEHAAYNLAAGETATIRALAEAAVRASGKPKRIVVTGDARPGVAVRRATGGKLRAAFDPAPFRSLDEGLAITVDWYRHALARR
ncbi:MAG TPA: NAD(P)-dependent oxidoreductase [Casimicrobiaceae bacterium]|nr:NAD(P)-dependent oxidoreductase [Casimicrobiaceae bacterium]